MSLDSGPSAALVSKKHDIAQTLLSRKRKLCELYAVATSPDPVPPYHDFCRDLSQQQTLALFLSRNDLEKGHLFQVSTLPSRPQRFTFNSRSHRSSKAVSREQRSSADAPPVPSVPQNSSSVHDEEPDGTSHGSSSNQSSLHVHGLETDDSSTESNPENATRASRERNKSRLAVASPSETRELRRSKPPTPIPIADAQSDRSSSRLTLDKHSRPESPPYSPGSEAIAAGTALVDEASLRKARDGSANILTPSKDEHDEPSPSQDHGRNKLDSQATSGVQMQSSAQIQQPTLTDNADSASSPSSATGQHSANTPHSEPRSPFTSPDEDVSQTQQATTTAQPLHDEGEDNAHRASPKAVLEDGSTAIQKSSGEQKTNPASEPQTSDQSKILEPSSEHTQPNSEQNSNTSKNKRSDNMDDKSAMVPQHGDKQDRLKSDAGTLPMDIDTPEHSSKRQLATPSASTKSSTFDKYRVSKSLKRRRKVIKVGKSRAMIMRNGVRDLQHAKQKGNKQDYFRPQVVRDVLNAVYRQDLNALLTNCNVSLTTSDWMLHNEEELYRILLQRTLHLQNTQRWSLKQLAPADEPRPEVCHWDRVLQEAKWLRTDFREERKLKISVARQLASWCAEWVNSTSEGRLKLQISNVSRNSQTGSGENSLPSSTTECTEDDIAPLAGDEESIFASPNSFLFTGQKARISKKLLSKIPEYSPAAQLASPSMIKRILPSISRSSRDQSAGRKGGRLYGDLSREPMVVSNIPPENTDCALFAPEHKQMRNRLNAVWIYKPPQLPMPSQGFYEHRSPSQWTWEDDQQLRQNVKDYGVNWHLISQYMTPKQEFYTTSDRRTPWECYERLLILDPPQHDLQARQYLKHFHFRIEKARASFEEQQSFIRTQAQQHARDVGQAQPNLMHKRFPTPTRVDRKPNKRFLAMLDASRKLARKRETALNKQEKSQQADAQAQRPPAAPSTGNAHTPQYFSRLKHEREVKDMERIREQQRVALMEQQRRQAGYQAALTNGIGQQMRNGMANGQVSANGHLAVPSHNQFRPPSQHPGIHAGLPNGIPPNAQMAAASRAQVNMQNQQRLVPHVNGQVASNQENIARLMQQQQQQQRFQQFNRGSPNNANTVPNLGIVPSYNGNNQFATTSDGMQSPSMPQQPQNSAASLQSPHIAQALAAAAGSSQQSQLMGTQAAPQALSSGHVPHFMTLQHQIHKSNPNMSTQEARAQATEQLKFLMRQNAINAASGLANPGQPHAGGNGGAEGSGGSQSPYPNAAQLQNAFQQNGILASSHPQHQGQGRGQSPTTAQQQQHSQYQAQLRQQIYNQQRQQQMGGAPGSSGSGGDSRGPSSSPGLAQALPNNLGLANMGLAVPMMGFTGANGANNRAPTPGGSMRPPSRATSGMDMSGMAVGNPGGEQQRPGSATSMAHSPRTVSAQGFAGQG